ncbi:hypothetical protein L1987_64548 [Smallanthus sonchifolius]|uniref:Uncharacterized protein n=1 Tax=Smallanthus sonchifolius TaxID=185202 RepID=A0ACB9BRX5_9ASTR|nr:hypothetical protein L1987_64548 [Smallanthus sonchifolius]
MRINEGDKKAKKVAEQLLYKATIAHQFPAVERILNEKVVTLRDKITVIGDTALHVAVATTKKKSEWEFLQNMLNLATQDNPLLLDVRNSQGSSLLHVAAITGHTEAAKMLVEKNEYLLSAKDNEGQTPVARALSNRHTDTYEYLKDCCIKYRDIEIGDMGLSELLVNIISSKDYESAYSLLAQIKKLPTETDTVLVAVAHNFPPTPNFWERIVSTVPKMPKFKFVESWKRKAKANLHAVLLLNLICYYSVRNAKAELGFFNNAVLEATRQNAEGDVEICSALVK